MKSVKFSPRTRSVVALRVVSLVTLSALGCAEDAQTGTEQAALSVGDWTFCANQGETCEFEGTRNVRFGAHGAFTYRTLTGSVPCDTSTFGGMAHQGAVCELLISSDAQLSDVAAQPATTPAATPAMAPTAVDTTVTPTASAPSAAMDHTHLAMGTTPTAAGTNSTAVATTAAAAPMMGPYINRAAIPQGSPGLSILEVRPTTEKPVANNDVGAFRTSCALAKMSNDDPLVFPGQPGKAHLHAFFGNTAVDAYSTADSIHNGGNSTCRGGIANRSAYWVPALIDDKGTPIKPRSAQMYYKTGYNGIKPQDVKVFPQGLRMIAGDARASAPGQEHAFWSCEVYNGHPNAIPDCPAGQAVIMMVFFPQCWNGKDLDSADHKSHLAYPVNGACPSTHPVAIPEISFNIWYDVPAGQRSSTWHLASDMYDPSKPGGYSAHADYIEGWQRDIAEAFVKNCDNTSSDCHSHLLGDGREIYSTQEGTD